MRTIKLVVALYIVAMVWALSSDARVMRPSHRHVTMTTTATTTTTQPPFAYPADLVGLWHMTNNWNDATTNASVGIYRAMNDIFNSYNATTNKSDGWKFGNSGYIGGPPYQEGGYGWAIAVTNTKYSTDQSTNFTISFWIKYNELNDAIGGPFTMGICDPYGGVKIGGNYSQANYYISNSISLHSANQVPGFSTAAGTWKASTDSNVWRHVCITYDMLDATPCHIYKDGVGLAVTTLSGPATNVASAGLNLKFGMRYDYNACLRMSGLAEVQVYNRSLSSNEVMTLYNQDIIP